VLLVPLAALVQRVPWKQVGDLLTDPVVAAAARVSAVVSLSALALSAVMGTPLAWLLARHRFPGRRFLRSAVTLPIVLPPVVGGVALSAAFGRRGWVGAPLEALTGWQLPFTTVGAVLAASFVSMPFLVVAAEAGFSTLDRRYEEAASTLGGGPWLVFRRVTVPLVAPSLGAGAALAWARALGEFGATITFAGNLPGRTQTIPLAIYQQLESRPEVAYLLGVVMLVLAVVVMVWAGAGIALGRRP
jgi:molybdate transport system permease protein